MPNRFPGREALIPSEPEIGSWASECLIDPLSVPLSDKGDLLTSATAEMRKQGADIAAGSYDIWDTRKWFVSSEGHRIDQHVRECGASIGATVVGDGETQVRSYPSRRGQFGTRGWELVQETDLAAHAARIADEARALARAPRSSAACWSQTTSTPAASIPAAC